MIKGVIMKGSKTIGTVTLPLAYPGLIFGVASRRFVIHTIECYTNPHVLDGEKAAHFVAAPIEAQEPNNVFHVTEI